MSDPAKLKAAMEGALKQAGVKSDAVTPPATPPVDTTAATPAATPPAVVTPTPAANTAAAVPAPEEFVPGFLADSGITPATPPVPQVQVTETPPTPPATPTPTDKEINFANLRRAKEAAEQRLAQIFDADGKVKADFIKTLKVESPDVSRLQQERDVALDRVARFDLQADPRWQAKYASTENAAVNAIVKFAIDYQVKSEDVANALKLSLRERTKFFQENLPDAVPMIAPHLATLDNIQLQKEQDIANAKQVSAAMDTQNTAAKERAIAETRQAIHARVVRELGQSGLYVFNERPGNDKWNDGVAKIKQTLAELLSTNDAMTHAMAMGMGAAAPVLLDHVKQQEAIIKDLTVKLKLHAGAGASIQTGPSPAGGAPASLSGKSTAELARMNLQEIAKKRSQKIT